MKPLDKPVERVITADVPHGVNPQLVVTLEPPGIITIREKRRRDFRVQLDIATLYMRGLYGKVMADREGKRGRG